MAGKKGYSGRKKENDLVRFRPHLILVRGQHDPLIHALETARPRHQGEILLAIIESGNPQAGLDKAMFIATRETALATQERTEINAGLMGLGSEFDE